tara:strand:+ start:43 stop:510 length:468 start_codon:yes stop_codon:yes gene_type:complete
MDPISLLTTIKLGISTGQSLAGLSKQLGQFFDATDNAKKKLQKKGITSSDVNKISMDRFAKLRAAADAEEQLKAFICDPRQSGLGPSHWQTLLKIRREVLQEKREAEAQARRDQIANQELMITVVGIAVLLVVTFVGCAGYLHYMGWLNLRDYFP